MKDMNYYNTFIEVAEDCPVSVAEVPKTKSDAKTASVLQYDMIADQPYEYTQEDVLFESFAARRGIPEKDRPAERRAFFSKGQPCLRTSALGKRYGWGIHHDRDGKVAIYAIESDAYKRFVKDNAITHLKALRSSRA